MMRMLALFMVSMYCVASAARANGSALANNKHVITMNEAIDKVMLERYGRKLSEGDILRFWNKVERRGSDECWPWLGGKLKGYGQFWVTPQNVRSHVVAHILNGGRFDKGPEIRHVKCRNPCCCNPAHLDDGTSQDNADDMMRDGTVSRGEKRSELLRRILPKGADNGNSKLQESDIRRIRELHVLGESFKAIGKQFGVTGANISCIVARKTWRQVS